MDGLAHATLRSVAAEVTEGLNELCERIVGVIAAREAPYGPRGIVVVGDLRGTVRANLTGMLAVLAGTGAVGDGELSVPRSTGRRRAQQGVPLEAVLRAYSLAGQSLMNALLVQAQQRSPDELAAFLEVATAALDVVDRYSQAVVDSYRQTEAESQRHVAQRQQAMFDALLDGRGADPAEAAELLGLPTVGPYVVLVGTFDLASDQTLTVARDACAVYGMIAFWHTRGDREIGIVALETTPVSRLLKILGSAVTGRVGVSAVIDSLQQVPDACRLADIALRTMPVTCHGAAWIEERLVESLLVSSPDLAGRLARHALGGILALRQPEREMLLSTLTAWYDNDRSANATATQLYCHRNTILNRLRRIEKLTGRSLEDHRDLLTGYLALLALRLAPS